MSMLILHNLAVTLMSTTDIKTGNNNHNFGTSEH